MKIKTLFFILWLSVFASCYHMYTKKEVIKHVKKNNQKKNVNIIIEDDNSVLKVLVRDSNYQKLDEIYHFNDEDKQLKYTLIASCDSCFQKFLLKEISTDGYKWKKLNDSTYLSKYSLKRILNIHKSTYSYDVVKHNLSKKEYEDLLKNAER
jgi:hypothetical protein